MVLRRLAAALIGTLGVAAAAGCGGNGSPGGPSPTAPRVTGITPTSGPSSGGTPVTISGSNFSGPAIVTIGGVPAASATTVSATSITAVTGARSAGAADVVVTIANQSGSLAGGFTYVSGQPPVIQLMTAQGTRARQPAKFADLDEEINVSVVAQDPDTPAANLTYGWSAPAGTFTDTGASVRWRAPQSFTTPGTVTLSVTVSDGALQTAGAVIVRVHDSAKEVSEMARQFLVDFSEQTLAPEQVVRNFTDACSGKASELDDVRDNQRTFDITNWSVGTPRVNVRFGGACEFRARAGDACATVDVEWTSRCIHETRFDGTKVCDLGQTYTTGGVDWVAARYAGDRWWLCSSDFEGTSLDVLTRRVMPGTLFKR